MALYLLTFIFGLIIGSFINAFLYRYQEKKTLMGRSFCPVCKHQLTWFDNIPLISWLMLSAKCRYCKKAISIQYPLVELSAGIIFLLIGILSKEGRVIVDYFQQIFNYQFSIINQFPILELIKIILLLTIFSVLLIISTYDVKNKEIPNGFNLSFIVVAFSYLILSSAGSTYYIQNTLYSLLAGAVAFAFFYSFAYFSKETWMGGGDAKLAFGVGLLLGPAGTFLAILIASWLGSIYGLTIIAFNRNSLADKQSGLAKLKNRKFHEIPFGPFLALGTLISFLFSSQIIDWYVRIFLGL